jgi:hypothetical protein
VVVVVRLREVMHRWLRSEGGWSCLQGSGCGEAGCVIRGMREVVVVVLGCQVQLDGLGVVAIAVGGGHGCRVPGAPKEVGWWGVVAITVDVGEWGSGCGRVK